MFIEARPLHVTSLAKSTEIEELVFLRRIFVPKLMLLEEIDVIGAPHTLLAGKLETFIPLSIIIELSRQPHLVGCRDGDKLPLQDRFLEILHTVSTARHGLGHFFARLVVQIIIAVFIVRRIFLILCFKIHIKDLLLDASSFRFDPRSQRSGFNFGRSEEEISIIADVVFNAEYSVAPKFAGCLVPW